MASFAFRATKWTLDIATKLIRSDVRVHNLEAVRDDMAILFAVNHFTRLETLLLPYEVYRHTGKEVWSLASAELFEGKIGAYLRSTGNVSTKDPDRDKIIIRSLLSGEHPWIIFPEGQMIKDKNVVGPRGGFQVYNRGQRRPPHSGAASLALRAEFYRQKMRCLAAQPGSPDLVNVLDRFGLDSVESLEKALSKRTVIVPVNITYFPIRAYDNFLVRFAGGVVKGLDKRAIEELSVEGTLLGKDSDIDITLGEPIDVGEFLSRSKQSNLLVCGEDDLAHLERDSKSLFHDAARSLVERHMEDIYRLTTINYDHLFASIVRYQKAAKFTERAYRNRIFLCAHEIRKLESFRLHTLLDRNYREIIYEDISPKFHDFMSLSVKEGFLDREEGGYRKNFGVKRGTSDFHAVRMEEITYVIANELEPLGEAVEIVKRIARAPRAELSTRIREMFLDEDIEIFNRDRHAFAKEDNLDPGRGRPYLLIPKRIKGGVVLVHGFLSAPAETRPLAEFLFSKGYAVYGVRLRGHGTSPEDLSATPWEEWYESLNRGYTVVKTLTDRISVGGFSTGGGLALLAAARKAGKIDSCFAINVPLRLRRGSVRFATSLTSVNKFLRRVKGEGWVEFVEHTPEFPEINYDRVPVAGIAQLTEAMVETDRELANVKVPTLIVQGSEDPTVDPAGAPIVFEKLGTGRKELSVFDRDRHVIILGEGAEEVWARVHRFLSGT